LAWVGAAWALAALVGLARLLARTAASWEMALAPADATISATAERLARELGIAPVPVLVSPGAALPYATAIPSARVVLPESLVGALAAGDLELVLRHELTHVARLDHLWSLLLEALKVAFALHPSARRLAAEVGLAREMAVDARIGAVAPRAYAHLLVDVAELHRFGIREAGEVSLEPVSLKKRIDMLTNPQPQRAARLLPTVALSVLFAGVGLLLPVSKVAAVEVADHGTLKLKVGGTLVLDHPARLEKIAIADPNVIDIRPLNDRETQVEAKGPGVTTLIIWTLDQTRHTYRVIVE
jgi:beta-lactamase regulating signal transducer with metallopeptidase domain